VKSNEADPSEIKSIFIGKNRNFIQAVACFPPLAHVMRENISCVYLGEFCLVLYALSYLIGY